MPTRNPSSTTTLVQGEPRSRFFAGLLAASLLGLAAVLSGPPSAEAQTLQDVGQARQDAVVRSATTVLNEIMGIPLAGIPTSMLADAHAVAIIPNVLKGGFVIGARYGRGVLLVRDEAGLWHAPVFITLTGGNIGWQAGVQATDVILVFRSRRSVEGILAGKFTLGADAAAAAGPIGRQASAATDQHLTAEILSYSRSRGLFAGVSLDGSVMQIDRLATTAYYPSVASGSAGVAVDAAQQVFIPEAAQQLTAMVAGYAGSNTAQVGPGPAQPAMAQQFAAQNAAALRGQLAQTSVSLYELLDDSWRAYLAMPAGVFAANEQPSIQSLQASLDRFESVAVDPRYQALASRAEFQSTHALLKNYLQAFTQTAAPLQLPPPPSLAPQ